MHSPRPWSCSECGARLQWRRNTVNCPTHGVLVVLSSYPGKDTEQDKQQQ